MKEAVRTGSRRARLLRFLSIITLVSILLTTSCHDERQVRTQVSGWSRSGTGINAPFWISDLLAVAARPIVGLLTSWNLLLTNDPESSQVLLQLRSDAFSLSAERSSERLTDPERAPFRKNGHAGFTPDDNMIRADLPESISDQSADPQSDLSVDPKIENDPLYVPEASDTPGAPDSSEAPVTPASPVVPVITPAVDRTIDRSRPMIALTFDDGPRLRTTGSILDTLKTHGAAATFFVLGRQVSGNEDALLRMAREGHETGNHTFNHVNLTRLSEPERKLELELTGSVVAAVTGKVPALVRPTFGATDTTLRNSLPMPLILWSVDTLDWKYRDPQRIVRSVLDTVRDGDIIILHDVYDSTARAIQTIVPELVSRGYQLVTVSELADARGVQLAPGSVFSRARPSTSQG